MSLKKLCNEPSTWNAFKEMLEAKIANRHKTLEVTNDMEQMLRTQGEIRALKHLLYLRDEVNGGSK